ncbi:MAG: hypothetical protein V1709_08465 [Planctomycetota bacterium]
MNNSLIKIIGLIIWVALFIPAVSSYAQESNTDIIIPDATYKIAVKDKQADVSFSLNVYNYQNKLSDIAICPVNLALTINKIPKDVFLIDNPQYHKLIFSKQGTFQVEGVFTVPININNEIKKISLPLVCAAVPKIDLTIPDVDIGVIILPESFYTKKESGRKTILSITPSVKDEITVLWGPAGVIKRPPENASVEILSRYEIENGAINSAHLLKFPNSYQGLQSLAIILPDNSITTKLDAPNLDRWFIETTNIGNKTRKVLNVYLRSYPTAGDPQGHLVGDKNSVQFNQTDFYLLLSLEQEDFSLGKKAILSPLQLIDFNINKGRIDIITPSDLLLDIIRLNEVNQIDAPRIKDKNIVSYTYSDTSASLEIIASRKQPEILASMEIYSLLHQQLAETTAKVSLNIKNIGINSINIKIPTGLTKISAKGNIIKSYNINNDLLNISFQTKIKGEQYFYLEYEQPVDRDKNLVILPFKCENITSWETMIGIKSDEVNLEIISLDKIKQIDNPTSQWLSSRQATVYLQASINDWKTEFNISPLKPAINAAIYEYIILTDDNLINETQLKITIKKAPIFSLDLKIPEGWTPLSISSSPSSSIQNRKGVVKQQPRQERDKLHLDPIGDESIKTWNFNEKDSVIKIDFMHPVQKEQIINLRLEKPLKQNDDKSIKILPLVITEAQQSEYYLGISADEDTMLQTDLKDAINEISINKLPSFYKNLSLLKTAFYATSSQWNLIINKTNIPPLVSAGISTGLVIREGQMKVVNSINYHIQNGRLNQLRIQLPTDSINYQINGENIKNIIHLDDNIKEIKLAAKIKGHYFLSVSYDIASSNINQMNFTPLKIIDANLDSGLVMVSRGNERTEIKTMEMNNAQVIPSLDKETKDTNIILKQLPYPPLQFLSFNKLDAKIVFSVKTHELSTFLPAKILSCDLFSLSRQSGEIVTYVSTVIENTAKQYLIVTLPPSTVLWGAYIDDKPVKPITNKKEEILIPLMPEKGALRQQTNVVFVYVQQFSSFANLKKFNFQMPKTDLNIEKATWHLFLPEKYYLSLPEGNMQYVYYDPVIAYPSLSRWAIGGISGFVNKIWTAIPLAVKRFAFLIIITLSVILTLAFILLQIIRYVFMRYLLFRKLLIYGGGGLAVTAILFGVLLPSLLNVRKESHNISEDKITIVDMRSPISQGFKKADEKNLELPQADRDMSDNSVDEIEACKESEDTDRFAFSGDVQQLKRLKQLAESSRAASKSGEKESGAESKSLSEKLRKEEQTKDKDEFDTESPIKGAGVYDTIGTGGGLAGKKRAGRSRARSSSQENAPIQPQQPGAPMPTTATQPQSLGAPEMHTETELISSLEPQEPKTPPSDKPSIEKQVAGLGLIPDMSEQSLLAANWNKAVDYGKSNEQIFGRTEKGRSMGALPLTVSVPMQNTYYYAFESQNLGKEKGYIGFYCFSGAIVLFLQLLGCLIITGTLFYITSRNVKTAVITNCIINIVCLFGYILSAGIISSIFITGFWFSLLILIVSIIWVFLGSINRSNHNIMY